ncbi:hypothetical protein ACTVZO_16215 [Streptomyces sp. IBSNAI002]|uniref:hypothetical protein n=1 Tax=Streptomyces sp. IBSNAI002 TaxID=3457500 RepID=UPI003FD2AF25
MSKADCDFCNLTGTARWLYVLPEDRPVVGLANAAGEAIIFDDDGLWHACIGCAGLVDREDITGLVQRAQRHITNTFPEMFGPGADDTWKAISAARYAAVMSPGTRKQRI